jgi:hypothetical protein
VSSVEIMIDDDGYSLTDGTTTWSKTIDTASWEKGSWHRIKVRAIDESGNGDIDIIGLKKKGGKGLKETSWSNESKFIEETIDMLYDNENDNTDATTEKSLSISGNRVYEEDEMLGIYIGDYKNIFPAIIISNPTEAQCDFINSHYDYVMTSILHEQMREKIQGPLLGLYCSIQGTWEDHGFDWNDINPNENMFCHNSSAENPHYNNRILTIWNSWLMDGADLVDKNAPDALNHWINYYAVTTSEQVYSFDYDGLFIDSAGHKLRSGAVYDFLPDNYSDDNWRDGRYVALEFIKSYFPDKSVIFNGLHNENGAEHSLSLTDGGVWENFGFEKNGVYHGEARWKKAIELVERNREESIIVLEDSIVNLNEEIEKRMFILASYLLVSNQNVTLMMLDMNDYEWGTIMYYPEYEIDLGHPLGNYTEIDNQVYMLEFEKGIVLVNPNHTESYTYTLDKRYHKVIPVGGGMLQEDGTYDGFLTYELADNEIILPPVNGVVLLNEDQVNLTINIEKPRGDRFYMFNRPIMPLKNTIIIERITVQAEVYNINNMDKVEFYIDDVLKSTDDEVPYEWTWNEFAFGNHEIKVVAYDNASNIASDEQKVWIFNI